MANDEANRKLTFAVSENGDFTSQLNQVTVNESVTISKPYGKLNEVLLNADKNRPLVMIIGGISITPFVSLIETLQNEIYLFYSVSGDKQYLYSNKLTLWEHSSNIHLFKQKHRFNMNDFITNVPNLTEANIVLAGPQAMNDNFKTQLFSMGVTPNNIYCENFYW